MKRTVLVTLVFILTCAGLSAQSQFSIGVNGVYLSPTGDFGNLYKNSFGGLVSLCYNATDNIQLSVSSGYSQFSFNNDKFNQMLIEFYGAEYAPNVQVNSNMKIIPVMLGGKYFFTSTPFKPYAGVDLGIHIVSVDASSVTMNGETFNAVKSESKTATAWGIGVGFLYEAAPKISIDVNAKVNGNNLSTGTNFSSSSSIASSSQSSSSTVTFVSVSAGVLFGL